MRRRWVRIANQRERNGGHPGLEDSQKLCLWKAIGDAAKPFQSHADPATICQAFWNTEPKLQAGRNSRTVAYAVPESLLFGTALEKLAYRQKRKALGPPQHHFGTTAPPVARHGAVLSSPRQWKTLRAEWADAGVFRSE